MKIVVALVAIIALAHAAPMAKLSLLPESEKKAMFHDHIVKFNKVYETSDEFKVRYLNFKASLERIDELNAKDTKATFHVTKFADLSAAEFKAFYLNDKAVPNPRPEAPMMEFQSNEPVESIAATADGGVDWRTKVGQYMTPVRNQGQCGSCWAFSTAENVASVSAIAGNPLIKTSVQQIVDCDTQSSGCGGGEPMNAYQYIIQAGGLESEQNYPYQGTNGQCNANPSEEVVKISSWNYIAQGGSNADQQMKTGVAAQPLSVCVEADTWQYYTGGVLSSNCGTNIDHCVILAGYGSEQGTDAWIVRNSWGTDWGVQGYIYIEIGQNLCAITEMVTTSVA